MSGIPLYVVADCSGSMAEPGKSGLLAYLLSYVAECVRLGQQPGWCTQVHALAWTDTVQRLPLPLALPLTSEPPALRLAGRADPGALMDELERELADVRGPMRVLLISDGGIDQAAQKRWQAWRSHLPIDIRALAVGADASRPALQALAGKDELFSAEEIGMALHDWTIPHAAPRSLAETAAMCAADTVADDWQ